MVLHNATVDPYSPERGYFECLDCGTRETSEGLISECADCGGEVRNIAVPRE
ncbi:rubrerythrin-like domain-containing protein [Halobium palmae]|uniref:Rubrerythrin-like domain-containing protein n=1 Tax=Halobium palmae TaxID=1776492 RepID=A0ABD5S6Z9_9EURY